MLLIFGSRTFPETLGRAWTRTILAQVRAAYGVLPLLSGLAAGPDLWSLEEALGLCARKDETESYWIGPDPRRSSNCAPELAPVWYASGLRVRLHPHTAARLAEVCLHPYRGDFGIRGGPIRNEAMRQEPITLAIALWDGTSRGTTNMLELLSKPTEQEAAEGKMPPPVFTFRPDQPGPEVPRRLLTLHGRGDTTAGVVLAGADAKTATVLEAAPIVRLTPGDPWASPTAWGRLKKEGWKAASTQVIWPPVPDALKVAGAELSASSRLPKGSEGDT
jgi:hypothetical protein